MFSSQAWSVRWSLGLGAYRISEGASCVLLLLPLL